MFVHYIFARGFERRIKKGYMEPWMYIVHIVLLVNILDVMKAFDEKDLNGLLYLCLSRNKTI